VRWLFLTLTIVLLGLATPACKEDATIQRREATNADLQYLLLTEDEVGSSYTLVNDGIEGIDQSCLSTDQACNVVLLPSENSPEGFICGYASLQRFSDEQGASSVFQQVREAFEEVETVPELEVDLVEPPDLLEDAIAGYSGYSKPPCPDHGGEARPFLVSFQISNLYVVINVWSAGDQGSEQAFSLALKQLKLINLVLASDH
jgi:hypothetical protein